MKLCNVPINRLGMPFNKAWKRVAMHLMIALLVAAIISPFYGNGIANFAKVVIFIFCGDVAQGFTHTLIHLKLEEKYDWLKDTKKRVFYAIVLHTVATFVLYFTIPVLYLHFVFDNSFPNIYAILLDFWVLPIGIVAFVMIFGVAGDFFKNWKESLTSEARLQAEMMNYKYESLRNQINPHFLLSSFSLLKKLILQDEAKAVDFIQKISSLYRHVLEVKDKEFVLLTEELQFLKAYISLLKLRYQHQLDITLQLAIEKDDLVAPLALQFIIENAVENNIISENDLLKIKVNRSNGQIEVLNSKETSKVNTGFISPSLKNLEQQYQFYSDKSVEYLETATSFSVKIPVLKQA